MKSPKMKFIIISAIGLVSIVGIFVSAQSPKPNAGGADLPVQILMSCVPVDKTKLTNAETSRPSDTYLIQYDGGALAGTLPAISPPPCAIGLVGNATQRATFQSTKDLRAFMDKAGL
jgi:hypothetical protein